MCCPPTTRHVCYRKMHLQNRAPPATTRLRIYFLRFCVHLRALFCIICKIRNLLFTLFTLQIRNNLDNIYVKTKRNKITHSESERNTYTSKIIIKQLLYFYNVNTN